MDIATDNFIEVTARLFSYTLTTEETEVVLSHFKKFQEKLQRFSSENLIKLYKDSEKKKKLINCRHELSCKKNTARGFIRAFATSFLVKYLLNLIPSLLTGNLFKNPSKLRKAAGLDTFNFSLFIAGYIAVFKATLCILRRILPSQPTPESVYPFNIYNDQFRSFIAGALASLTIFFDKNKSRRIGIALYLTSRSGQFACRFLMRKWEENRMLKKQQKILKHSRNQLQDSNPPTPPSEKDIDGIVLLGEDSIIEDDDSDHSSESLRSLQPLEDTWEDTLAGYMSFWGGPLVMMFSSSQILYTFLICPKTLPKSYYSFLLTHSGKRDIYKSRTKPYMSALRKVAINATNSGKILSIREAIEALVSEGIFEAATSAQKATPPHQYGMCSVIHPNTSNCLKYSGEVWILEYLRSLKLYIPLNIITSILLKWKASKANPKNALWRLLKSTLRSSLFLSSYVTTSWLATCICRRVTQRENTFFYFLNGILAGSCVLMESRGRRLELGLYCLPRALESLWKMGVANRWWKNIRNGEILYFSFAMGVTMSLYQNDPESIPDGYRDLFYRFFGDN